MLYANAVVGLVAVLHLFFLVLEMFFWNKPLGRRVFGQTPEFAQASAALAANQGLYNGFLAAGTPGSISNSGCFANHSDTGYCTDYDYLVWIWRNTYGLYSGVILLFSFGGQYR